LGLLCGQKQGVKRTDMWKQPVVCFHSCLAAAAFIIADYRPPGDFLCSPSNLTPCSPFPRGNGAGLGQRQAAGL
jgi:hypothetical protein